VKLWRIYSRLWAFQWAINGVCMLPCKSRKGGSKSDFLFFFVWIKVNFSWIEFATNSLYTMSQKTAKLFLPELHQMSTNFDNFWQKDDRALNNSRCTHFLLHLIRVITLPRMQMFQTVTQHWKLLSAMNFLTT